MVHLVAVHVVHPLRPDLVRGAVVDDDVAHGRDSSLAKRRVESHEFVLVAVLARIQVPQVPGEVPLGAETECDGGGSQRCVTPAAAMSGTMRVS